MNYEYIRLEVDMGDLSQLNRFSGDGWRVVSAVPSLQRVEGACWVLLERPLPNDAELEALADRVVKAAIRLAKAGTSCGAGELPYKTLHDLYDAVREYESEG